MMIKKTSILVFICFVGANLLFSQNYELTFSGSGVSVNIDSIFVENLFTGETAWVYENQILQLNGTAGNTSEFIIEEFELYPNPAQGTASVSFYSDLSRNIAILICNADGQIICKNTFSAHKGKNVFLIDNLNSGYYTVSISSDEFIQSKKLVSLTGTMSGLTMITHKSHEITFKDIKQTTSQKSFVSMNYVSGQRLIFKAYSQMYKRVVTYIPSESTEVMFEFVECIDYDNNSYAVVEIGDYVWMAENLKTTHYDDGTPLIYCNDNDTWQNLSEPAWRWCNESVFYSDSLLSVNYHGLAYHGISVDPNQNDNKNLCPSGWHVPNSDDWTGFISYLGTNGYNYDDTFTDEWPTKVGKSLASCHDWAYYNAAGAVGNTDLPEYRNKSGFSALPGPDGQNVYWWTSTQFASDVNFGVNINYMNTFLDQYYYYQNWDMFFVRCLKN